MLLLSSENSMSYENKTKILHNKFNNSFLQGTWCKLASAETVVEEWRSNTEFRQDAVQKADWYFRHTVNGASEWYWANGNDRGAWHQET
jgi:hypothetical protein